MHGVGEEEALVQTKAVPCFYKMLPCKVAVPMLFGADLTCFSVPIRSLAGRVLVAVRCWWCKLACPLHLFPLPLAWCAPHPRLPRRSPAGGAKVIVNSEEAPPPPGAAGRRRAAAARASWVSIPLGAMLRLCYKRPKAVDEGRAA